MTYIHHPDKGFTGTIRVGARNVEFKDGKAQTDFGPIARTFKDAGFAVSKSPQRVKAADESPKPTETPGDVLDH